MESLLNANAASGPGEDEATILGDLNSVEQALQQLEDIFE